MLTAALALAESTRSAIDDLPGLHVMEFDDLVHSFDPLKIVIDVSGLHISGYQATDWLREHQRVTLGLSDHRRVVAQFTHADDPRTAEKLVEALRALTEADLPSPKPVDLPTPDELQLETAMLPRDAFFAEVEQVPVERAAGRISAEMITPYPPGAPAVLPGEVITEEVLDYVRSGLAAGMVLPDPADSELESVRVVSSRVQSSPATGR
jgi:arginine/lysine/ornithine decarboxylase